MISSILLYVLNNARPIFSLWFSR